MLSRAIIASLLVGLLRVASGAAERDLLQRGEEQLTGKYQIIYDHAVRHVLSRAWHKDVIVRTVDFPPFQPESSVGIARSAQGFLAFELTASNHIWAVLDFDNKQGKGDYRSVRALLHERQLSAPLAARIAALWRRVLTNPRNYTNDNGVYLDSDQFTYYVAFLPHERLNAYITGWGPQTLQLMKVAGAIAGHANGAPEAQLIKAVKNAERKLGI